MSGKPSAAMEKARKYWLSAPEDNKPTALEVARKFRVSESTVHRARAKWRKENSSAGSV